jgi:hypothetical protein
VTAEPGWKASRSKRWQAAAIAEATTPLIRLLARTWRFRVEGREHLDAADAARQPLIVAFWHGRILPGIAYFRDRGIVVITSENFDGEWIARIIHRFGYGTARGSSSRGAVKALVRLRKDMAGGRWTAFTVDGPRGPRRVAQPGAVWLARSSGHAILPFHAEADRAWTIASWDRAQIPKPFAAISLCIAEPLTVAPDEDVDAALARLQAALEAIEARTVAAAGRPASPLSP